jgi:hypothetical protein
MSEAGLVIGVLEDNDDTASGNCGWVLSFRDKLKLNGLVFKPTETSTPLRALIGARVKTDREKMLLHKHFAQRLLHLSEIPKESALPFGGEVVVAVVVAILCCLAAATTIVKPKLFILPLIERRVLLRKNPSEQVDDDCCVDYYSEGVYPDLVVD